MNTIAEVPTRNEKLARKLTLPHLEVTEITSKDDPEGKPVTILQPGPVQGENYFVRPKLLQQNGYERFGQYQTFKQQYDLVPIVLDQDGVPWAEAVTYILSLLEDAVDPTVNTFSSIGDDLVAYRRFLDMTVIDWSYFPPQKLSRPTYRFNGHLKFSVMAGEVAASTAKRRMGTVVRFYRWLIREGVLTPENPPWKEHDIYIDITDGKGFKRPLKVITTDVTIKVPKQHDPYDGTIEDGEKLRPLPIEEQEWVIDALNTIGNTEMKLIQLMGFLTGARIQSILTMQLRHVKTEIEGTDEGEVRLPVGPGTGIDTKNNKKMVIHIPKWFYRMLNTYALSDRAKKRRERAVSGDIDSQYLFLSFRGGLLYRSKKDRKHLKGNKSRRYLETGQAIRVFMGEKVIPFIRKKYGVEKFRYRFHDTRATAGMNWTDHQLKLVEAGLITLSQARDFVRVRMGHESPETTDRYLGYRKSQLLVRWAVEGYDDHIRKLTDEALRGLM
jgi:integrase